LANSRQGVRGSRYARAVAAQRLVETLEDTMSNAVKPGRAAAIKSALESAFIALLASGACLWFLISETQASDDGDPARLTMFSIGLGAALCAHLVYMAIAARRAERSPTLWMILMLVLMPFASVVLGILLFNQVQEIEHQAVEQS
jgi:dipeptide/tripeptide permease